MKLFVLAFLLIPNVLKAEEIKDTTSFKNSFKLDFISLYHTLFDARKQIRAGVEYERKISSKAFLSAYLDIGLYDLYVFRKYYDFFNQNQGMYYVQQNVEVIGFHFIPTYNYYVLQLKNYKKNGLFLGAGLDCNVYRKKLEYYNSQSKDRYSNKYNQFKLALAASVGWRHYINSRFSIELKTSLFSSVFKRKSDKNKSSIRPIISQWSNPSYNYWNVSNFKICYDF